MTFLQPLMLLALPLIALPILIHLVNQNRHRSIHWAATMFLIQAQKMVTGMRRLRYWLILAARTLAMLGLVFAISRPMSGGWLGLTVGGAPDTTVIILDRSVSMEQQDPVTGLSRRETAVRKLADLLQTTGPATQLVLIDSASGTPLRIESPGDLIDLPETRSTATTADIPALLQTAAEYLAASQAGRTDVWVCSDLQRGDWNPEGGRWEAVRELFKKREGTKLYLLTFDSSDERNLSVRVDHVHRRELPAGAELVMDLAVTRTGPISTSETVPLTIVINGARSTLNLEVTGGLAVKTGHAIPIDQESKQGWGRVELPADSNAADNVFGFVYAEAAVQKTVIVSDDEQIAEYFRIATATPASMSLVSEASILTTAQVAALPWDTAGLIVWQAAIPDGAVAEQLRAFVAAGRSVMFFPPTDNDAQASPGNTIFGGGWGEWIEPDAAEGLVVSRWRTETDLLSNSQSGTPLPAGTLKVFRFRQIQGRSVARLAELSDGEILVGRALDAASADLAASELSGSELSGSELSGSELAMGSELATGSLAATNRAAAEQGAVWFCSTLPAESHSTLVRNGVVFYVMMQRALAQGAAALSSARQLECRPSAARDVANWKPLDDASASLLLSERSVLPGVYQNRDDVLLAFNRPLTEDVADVIDDVQLQQILGDVGYTKIQDAQGGSSTLASEIWRAFLCLMIVALLAEALLCVPERTSDRMVGPPPMSTKQASLTT